MAGRYKPYPEYKDSGIEGVSEIPDGWSVLGLSKVIEFMNNGSSANQIEEVGGAVKVTRIETISRGAIDLDKTGYVLSSEIPGRFKLEFGDIQLSNINSLSMVGNCAIFNGDCELYAGMNLLHIRPNRVQIFPGFMLYQFKTKWFRNKIEANAKPAINQASIPASALKSFEFIRPAFFEQKAIANFLDHETAKIDTLIEKQQLLIQLLKEKRQAVISHAVTKGLNPKAKMRDSGIGWLGEMPEGWGITRAKFVSSIFVPQRNKPELNTDYGTPWITMEDMTGEYVNSAKYLVDAGAAKAAGSKVLKTGSVVASCVGNFGIASINKLDIIINQQLQAFIPRNIKAEYLRETILISKNYFELIGTAATLVYVNQQGFENLPILVPPKNEQTKICEKIKTECSKIDKLIALSESAISLIQERRTALISAAVTGKIDVRNWVAPENSQSNKEVAA